MAGTPSPARTALVILAAGAAALGALWLVPAGREFLLDHAVRPLAAQATGRADGVGYSVAGLVLWGAIGAWLASAAWLGIVRALHVPADRRLALALSPFLLWGPLAHALLQAGAYVPGSARAWLAAEPLVYVTTGALAAVGLALAALGGRARDSGEFWWPGSVIVGAVALAVLAPPTARALAAGDGRPGVALAIVAGSLAVAFLVLAAGRLLAPRVDALTPLGTGAGAAVVAAHAIDGFSTWAVLRDPFGVGIGGYTEKNPVADALVQYGNGWPFPVVKILLAVGLAVILWQGTEKPEDRPLRTPAFLALFVLGWGPGVSNLLLVAFGG